MPRIVDENRRISDVSQAVVSTNVRVQTPLPSELPRVESRDQLLINEEGAPSARRSVERQNVPLEQPVVRSVNERSHSESHRLDSPPELPGEIRAAYGGEQVDSRSEASNTRAQSLGRSRRAQSRPIGHQVHAQPVVQMAAPVVVQNPAGLNRPPLVQPQVNHESFVVTGLKKIGTGLVGLVLLPFVLIGLAIRGIANVISPRGPDSNELIQAKLGRGKQLLRDIEEGNVLHPATKANVGDIMYAIKYIAEANGEPAFTSGSYTIPDPGRRISDFLKSCPATYQRLSSHIMSHQSANGGTHLGIDSGTDFPPGKKTLLFGSLVTGGEDRLYVKLEEAGAAVSFPVRGVDRNMPNRSLNFWDFMELVHHAFTYLATRGHGDAAGSRKERIPGNVRARWERLNQAFPDNAILQNGAPEVTGINQMLSNVLALQAGGQGNEQTRDFINFVVNERGYNDPEQNRHRIGNEIVITGRNWFR